MQQIAQRCWILERVRAVGVKESAAIRAKHLDDFLRGYRPLRDHLGVDGLLRFRAVGCLFFDGLGLG